MTKPKEPYETRCIDCGRAFYLVHGRTPATYVKASVEESFRQSQFPDTLGTKLQFNDSAVWYNEMLMASALTNPLGLAPEL